MTNELENSNPLAIPNDPSNRYSVLLAGRAYFLGPISTGLLAIIDDSLRDEPDCWHCGTYLRWITAVMQLTFDSLSNGVNASLEDEEAQDRIMRAVAELELPEAKYLCSRILAFDERCKLMMLEPATSYIC